MFKKHIHIYIYNLSDNVLCLIIKYSLLCNIFFFVYLGNKNVFTESSNEQSRRVSSWGKGAQRPL